MVKRLVERYDRFFQRLFEILPGVITWSVILSPLWLGRIAPLAVAFFITFLITYWGYRALIHLFGISIGYRRYQAELAVDWSEKVQGLWGYDRLKHLIIIPAVNEPYEVLEESFASLAAQKYPKDRVFISFSAEEKYASRVLKDIERIKRKFGKKLGTVWTTAHPYGLPGEAVGAAANRTWAAKHALKEIKKLGMGVNDFILTTLDADMRFHPQYLPRLSHAFLTEPDRLDKFFQTALYLFDNNLWDVPPLMRIQANSLSLAVLASWVAEPEH
ncbi:MAG: glycosyltransferase family A protein, partial [Patescibacteria group bacterium]